MIFKTLDDGLSQLPYFLNTVGGIAAMYTCKICSDKEPVFGTGLCSDHLRMNANSFLHTLKEEMHGTFSQQDLDILRHVWCVVFKEGYDWKCDNSHGENRCSYCGDWRTKGHQAVKVRGPERYNYLRIMCLTCFRDRYTRAMMWVMNELLPDNALLGRDIARFNKLYENGFIEIVKGEAAPFKAGGAFV